jgi:hypothetical protein
MGKLDKVIVFKVWKMITSSILNFDEVIIFKTLKMISLSNLPMAFFLPDLIGEKCHRYFLTFEHVFDEVVFDEVITLMETLDEVITSYF